MEFDLGGIFSFAKDLFSIGRQVSGIVSNFNNREILTQQEGFYDRQAELSERLGRFNEQVALQSGGRAVDDIVRKTDAVIGHQKANYHLRGVEWEGSPRLLAEHTLSEGKRVAFEAAYNAEIDAINARYGWQAQSGSLRNASSGARYANKQNRITLMDQLFGLGNYAVSSAALNQPRRSLLDMIFGGEHAP
jgi:hypothetical protein